MSERDTLTALAEAIAFALEPLADALESTDDFIAFMSELGWTFDQLPQPIANLKTPVQDILDLVESGEVDLGDVVSLINGIKSVALSIRDLANSPDSLFPPSVDASEFKSTFPAQLVEFLVVEYLLGSAQVAGNLLRTIGVIELEEVANTATRPAYVRLGFAWNELAKLLDDPFATFKNVYGWGTANFDPREMLDNVFYLAEPFGIDGEFTVPSAGLRAFLTQGAASLSEEQDEILQLAILREDAPGLGLELGIGLFMLPKTGTDEAGFALVPYGTGRFEHELDLGDELTLKVKSEADLGNGIAALLRPGKGIDFVVDIEPAVGSGTAPKPSASFVISLRTKQSAGEKRMLIGSETGSRLETGALSATAGVRANAKQALDAFAEVGLEESAIVIKPGADADSFLTSLLPADGFTIDFGFLLGFSSAQGLYFGGSGGLEINLPVHVSIGPIELVSSTLSVKGVSGKVAVEIGASVDGKLGPLEASIDNMGLRADFDFPSDSSGNLGPIDAKLAFKPPSGVGLSIDAGGLKGGGFLKFEPDQGRYVGAIELEFKDSIALKAIGLITTKLPDGSDGFSLLVIITAEFTPIQLGFGFTLNGVGGLLGLNRTVVVARLRSGVKDNTLKSILFPTNIVANANRIISDLRQVFPPAQGQFLIGPMAKIGWGTPTLITVDLGLVVELPDPVRIAILGVLKTLLPDENSRILRLQVNFLGVLDFEQEMLSFDASIYDSKLLSFTLSGDMALRIKWGSDPNFLLSVGGFHPAYQPPPLALPTLARLSISLLGGSNPRISIETYFAVTSNTVQFGAKAELYAGAGPFNVYGFIGFDVLFQFDPFYFNAAIGAMLALRSGSSSIASISLAGSLEGPTPWKVKGKAKLKLFWFLTIKVKFSKQWGSSRDTELDDIKVLPLLKAALGQTGNWKAEFPSRSHLLVSLRSMDTSSDAVIAHPFGTLSISQKVVPLNLEIDKFGNRKPSDASKFSIKSVTAGEGAGAVGLETRDVSEQFAPAQFLDLKDSDKLSSKSFENYDGGVTVVESETLRSGRYAMREVEYELDYIDSQRNLRRWPFLVAPDVLAFNAWASKGAIARSPLSFEKNKKPALAPDSVKVSQEAYAIVNRNDLSAFDDRSMLPSEGAAISRLNQIARDNPAMASELQIVPAFEVPS